MSEVLTCVYCGEKIIPNTIGEYLRHLEAKHPQETQAIGSIKRLLSRFRKGTEEKTIKCPWCGEFTEASTYSQHYDTCPKRKEKESSTAKKPNEVMTVREFRGMVVTMSQAIETSTFRLGEHFRTGLPLDRELIRSEFEAIEKIGRAHV